MSIVASPQTMFHVVRTRWYHRVWFKLFPRQSVVAGITIGVIQAEVLVDPKTGHVSLALGDIRVNAGRTA